MSKKKKREQVRRQERRFFPQSTFSPVLVRGFGALGAAVLGAGAFGMARAESFLSDEKLKAIPSYMVAGGAILSGLAIWLGTSSDPPIRVGAPGVGMDRGETRRMPWWAIDQVSWKSGAEALVVSGKDDAGQSWTLEIPLAAQPQAVAWIVEEAQRRIPKRVDLPEETLSAIPRVDEHAGLLIELDPLQVVGKRCAASDKIISYEPDARVCTRCERVYAKGSVPKKCKCGATLAHLRGKGEAEAQGDDEGEAEEEVRVSSREKAEADTAEAEA